jgi:serpin B
MTPPPGAAPAPRSQRPAFDAVYRLQERPAGGPDMRVVSGAGLAAGVLGAAALLGACKGTVTATPPAICDAKQAAASDTQDLATSNTEFAMALYGPATQMAAGQNAILSPYSASATLAMVDVGARGETDAQIRTVLHLAANAGDGTDAGASMVSSAYASLECTNETDGTETGDQLSVANSLWGQQGLALEPDFLSGLSAGYGAPLQTVDFEGDPSGAERTVNAWVSKETSGQIPALLQGSDVTSETRLVLADAIYFKGSWKDGFDPANTMPGPFQLADGTTAQVPMMSATVSMGINETIPDLDVYELPYKGGGIAMDFLMPTKGTLAAFEATLTADSVQVALAGLQPNDGVIVNVPKFKFATRFELSAVLAGMGMPDLFDKTKADLSGIDGAHDLSVSAVVQQAFVEVDEQGTVAAAATAAVVCQCLGGSEPLTVQIDQPFVFLIRDVHTGSILFMGRVLDPRQGD